MRSVAERDDFFKEKLEIVKAALQQLKDDKKIVDFVPIGGGETRRNPDFLLTCIKGPRHVGHHLYIIGNYLYIYVRNGKRDGNDSSIKVSPLDSQDQIERKVLKLLQRP
jgi:hypothetical protein